MTLDEPAGRCSSAPPPACRSRKEAARHHHCPVLVLPRTTGRRSRPDDVPARPGERTAAGSGSAAATRPWSTPTPTAAAGCTAVRTTSGACSPPTCRRWRRGVRPRVLRRRPARRPPGRARPRGCRWGAGRSVGRPHARRPRGRGQQPRARPRHRVVRIWQDDDALMCEIRDVPRVQDPLVGRTLPAWDDEGGRGLWMANHLCDLVQVRSGRSGTTVRISTWLSPVRATPARPSPGDQDRRRSPTGRPEGSRIPCRSTGTTS